MSYFKYKALTLSLLLGLTTQSQGAQSLTQIDKLVKEYIEHELDRFYEHQADYTVTIAGIDSRLQLEECLEPLAPELESSRITQSHLTVKVSCASPKKWAIRVPVKVQLFKEIALTSQNIQKDQPITVSDVKLVRTDVSQVSDGYFNSVDELVGLIAQRPLSSNTIIMHHMVKQPLLIRRGENVKLLVKAPGLTIEGLGVAQTDGIKGQLIRVKNSRSNRVVEATVEEPGVVVVPL